MAMTINAMNNNLPESRANNAILAASRVRNFVFSSRGMD